jgi:hypothetical protein
MCEVDELEQRLRAELMPIWNSNQSWASTDFVDILLRAARIGAEVQCAKLRAALRKYGQHRPGCSFRILMDYQRNPHPTEIGRIPCDCGLNAERAE